ncbi:hypothetical protein [Methanosarcina mazei]|uniref:Uncharacterized protein n=1 Tax=Methanosarcina mazei TaxID=2209 RepID=A0A0F8MEF3_METMZ|nr:hypothetical protein [Methanosarcina mazei]KKG07065.1 hypothetical protein DU47_04520 [Methanosarcina mazei]KKG83930.1 hypothetical protein DU57_14755 [Methanosarcina mazei]KKG91032.1 hypothetical protein DU69_09160 [Methanosarcina mazei]KKG91548.1 hypothetical protein DU59_15185 [Methanosarcina mazei]KKH10544.1 hypothetical protein DU42_13365 [Methanosarcina mazei]
MNFYIIRLSFNKLKQKELFVKEYHGTKMELVERLLQENSQYIPETKKGHVNFHFGNFRFEKSNHEERLYFATLGKYKISEIKRYNQQEKEHYKEKTTSSPWIVFLIDRNEQVFIIQKDTAVFPKYDSLFNSIKEHLNSLLHEYDLSVSLAPITFPNDFWKHVDEYDFIYTVNFELFMPNLFGDTNKSAEEILSDVHDRHNADKLSAEIENSEGALKLSRDDEGINNWLDWIGKGGGKWFMWCKKGTSRNKNKIVSTKEAQAFSTTTDIEPLENERNLHKSVTSTIKELKKYYFTQNTSVQAKGKIK